MKVLNLYAGIGGNRKLWPNDEIEVTAIELNPQIAKIYQDFFPNDKVIVADAHQFLLAHFEEFDFIWSSPPCPTHSKVRFMGSKSKHPITGVVLDKKYPDMNLYQEVIFLDNYFKNHWVVENVIGYYEPLIKPFELGMHYFWSNFLLGKFKLKSRSHNSSIEEMQIAKGFNLSKYDLRGLETSHKKDLLLRNCVEPELGLHIFNMAFRDKQKTLGEVVKR
jgi:DNA (cytosine-5)-methyltransferase 1